MKNMIILFIAFLYSFQAPAHANPYLMDYETFVHLDSEQKDLVVINFMQLVVEMDSKFEKAKGTASYSPARHEEFKRIVQKIFSLIIESSYAQDANSEFATYAEQFKNFLDPKAEKFKQDKCIYAGWVSKMKNGFCQHPSGVGYKDKKDKWHNDPVATAYLKNNANSKGKQTCGAGTIACNPVVFGYKSEASKTLFCAPTSDNSHNSSYNCMRYALREVDPVKEKALYDDLVKNSDTKEQRLEYMKKQMESEANRNAFNTIHGYLFDSCICQNKDSNTAITAGYRNYMRPHRTCFGLIYNMRELHKACPIKDDNNFPEFAGLNAFFRGKLPTQKHTEGTGWTDEIIIKNLKAARKEDSVRDTFGAQYDDLIKLPEIQKQFCPFIKPRTCTTKCGEEKIVNGKSQWECTVSKYLSGKDEVDLNPPFVAVVDENTKQIEVTGKPGLFCPVEVKKTPVADSFECKLECVDEMDKDAKTGKYTCTVKEVKKNTKPEDVAALIKDKKIKETYTLTEEEFKTNKHKIEIGECSVEKLADNKCKVTVSEDKPTKTLTAEVTFPGDPKGKDLEVKWHDGFSEDPANKQKATLKDWDGKATTFKFADKATGKLTCEFPMPARNEAEVKCTLAQVKNEGKWKDKKVTAVKVVATYPGKKYDEEITDIVWKPVSIEKFDNDTDALIPWDGEEKDDAKVTLKAKVGDKPVECDLPLKKDDIGEPKKDEYKITIKGDVTTATMKQVVMVNITVPESATPMTEIHENYTVVWVRGAATDLTFPKVKVPEEDKDKSTGVVGDPEKEKKDDEGTTKEEELVDVAVEKETEKTVAGHGKKLSADRKEHSYYVVAHLKKGDVVVAESTKVKIPKKEGAYTPNQATPPQKMMRQKIDTWTNKKL